MTCQSPSVVVVGGGLGGLATALFAARRGKRVELVERDPAPPPATVDGVPSWVRRGTPQAHQSHAFVARCYRLLAVEAPDVLERLRAAGVGEIALSEDPPSSLVGRVAIDPDLVVLAARRPVFEWALRCAVEAEPDITVRAGAAVVGLDLAPAERGNGGVPSVRGVVLDDGVALPAEVVVDAGGRRSPVPSLLDALGVDQPVGREVQCGIAYTSQFFRLRSSGARPPLNRGYVAGGSFDRYSCLAFPADNDTFSVTFGTLPEDRDMRSLGRPDGFAAAARAIPVIAPWVDPERAEPISDVATMHGLTNRLRPLVCRGVPVVAGLLAVGDAACITNPAHTRGSTLALTSAWTVAEAIERHDDPIDRALVVDTILRHEHEAWFWDSVEQDGARLARWRPNGEPLPDLPQRTAVRVTNAEAYLAAQGHAGVWHRFTRLQQLLELPATVLEDPTVVSQTRAILATGWRPPAVEGPEHDELVAIANGARDRCASPS